MNPKREKKPRKLPSGDAAKLAALAKAKGLKGLRESEVDVFLALDHAGLVALAQGLEEAGLLRILSFEPLVFVSRESIDHFGLKLVRYLGKFHEAHPTEKGPILDRIRGHFEVPRKILQFALKSLVHEGLIKEDGASYALPAFVRELPPREENLLRDLEEMCFDGDFRTVTLQDIRDKFKLTPHKLDQMLEILVERKRIVQNKEGFFLHQRWLDDVIAKVRALGRRELPVAEFKALTGLSRKFAIPLLELLDELGVTRRRGSSREIL